VKIKVLGEKFVLLSLYPPQIAQWMPLEWIRASALWSRRLSTWATAQSGFWALCFEL